MWPAAIALAGTRRAAAIAIGALVVAPVVRVAAWYAVPEARPLTDQAFPCVFDALATGCLLAMYREQLERSPRYQAILRARWLWPAVALVIGSLAIGRPWIGLGISMTLANIALALVIHRCMTLRDGPVFRFLEHPVMVRIGVLSYSLYLWQQLFLDRRSTAWVAQFPINVVLAVVAAWLSYELIERRFLRLAHRAPSPSGTASLAPAAAERS